MIIHAGARCSGKTTEAIILASSTGSALIVPNKMVANFVLDYSREIGYPVPVLTATESISGNKGRCGEQTYVIDDLQAVLEQVFKGRVIMATTKGAVFKKPLSWRKRIANTVFVKRTLKWLKGWKK